MNKKKVKDVLIKMMISGIVMFLLYYIYIVFDTRNIMLDIKQVAAGGEIDNPVYNRFEPFHISTSQKIRRYFTWCWGSHGEIWLGYERITQFTDGTAISKDYCSVVIEKKNGRWEAIKIRYEP